MAVSDAEGRFHFELDKAASDWPYGDEPAWHQAQIAAVAPGFALAWVEAGSLLKGDEAILRLVRDDVPIRGRVVDPGPADRWRDRPARPDRRGQGRG